MQDCIFCKIVQGEIPSYKVYENDKVLAFLDIRPVNYGHTLVIPKTHHKNLIDTPDDLLCEIITVVKKLAPAVKGAVGLKAHNLVVNSGEEAGQVVFHTHFHIIPRFEGDGYGKFRIGPYKEGEAEEVAEKIIKSLDH